MLYPGIPVRQGGGASDVVRAIQQKLADLRIPESSGGKALEVDGIFGPSTEDAVKLFQAQAVDPKGRALEIDGVVGPMTWAALFRTEIAVAKPESGTLLARVIQIARSQVGVMEEPIGSNRGTEVDQYVASTGLKPEGEHAWCVCFLYWCFMQAADAEDRPNPMPRTAGVLDLWRRAGDRGLLRVGRSAAVANPASVRPGMIFIIDSGGGFGHAGLVRSVQGVTLTTIEGNTTDKTGSREGVGVFERRARTISSINTGFIDVTRTF
ncbi:peptidoglycan-binding protein [Blastomonas sp.]|uniref:peptidoglycan-binding protein n=1 Tax=Blastomonas sp. TaxID=1909299 RepID=UPI00406AAC1F